MTSSNGDGREHHLAPVTDLFSRRTEHARPVEAVDTPVASKPSVDGPLSENEAFDADGWWVDPAAATDALGAAEASTPAAGAKPDTNAPRTRHAGRGRGVGGEQAAEASLPGLMRASELEPPRPREPAVLPWSAEAPEPQESLPASPRARASKRVETTQRDEPSFRAEWGTPRLRAVNFVDEPDEPAPETFEEQCERAEQALVKKLTGKGLSLAEARTFLRGLDIEDAACDQVIDECVARGYLNDSVLAEQLVYTAVSRKKQGRRAVAQSLSARGIDRETIAAALDELPDDDAERALDFARTKAMSLSKLDADVALRRLVGQLARRGFPGNVAMQAAKAALAEVSRPNVRFR